MRRDIFILGFGRSGTTWISDIVSKTLGGLVLFEPMHPEVFERAKEFCYSALADGEGDALGSHLEMVLTRGRRNGSKWLLRNHVPGQLEEVTDDFCASLWDECEVLGLKSIRANFAIESLLERFNPRIVYIARHPCAVVASLLRRPRFFLEFGWPEHYHMFLERTVRDTRYAERSWMRQRERAERAETDVERYAIMWSITHLAATEALTARGLPVFYYEDFYRAPFGAVRHLLTYLGETQPKMHPAYIFTPSMLTLRTVHGLYDGTKVLDNPSLSFFWRETLSDDEVRVILDTVAAFGIEDYSRQTMPSRPRQAVAVVQELPRAARPRSGAPRPVPS